MRIELDWDTFHQRYLLENRIFVLEKDDSWVMYTNDQSFIIRCVVEKWADSTENVMFVARYLDGRNICKVDSIEGEEETDEIEIEVPQEIEEEDLDMKAKYIRRTGASGNYRYFYNIPKKITIRDYAKMKNREIPRSKWEILDDQNKKFLAGDDTLKKYYKDGEIAVERVKLVGNIINSYAKQAKQAKSTGKPKVIFMAGLPGSGKTYATQNMYKKVEGNDKLIQDKEGNKYIVLSADDIKEKLPEYEGGIRSNEVHRESSKINSILVEKYTEMGYNIVIDGTLKDVDRAERQISKFHKSGYEVNITHVDVPVKMSIDRAHARFKETGRYVSYDAIIEFSPQVTNSINKIKNVVDSYVKIDNSGTKPMIVEELKNE